MPGLPTFLAYAMRHVKCPCCGTETSFCIGSARILPSTGRAARSGTVGAGHALRNPRHGCAPAACTIAQGATVSPDRELPLHAVATAPPRFRSWKGNRRWLSSAIRRVGARESARLLGSENQVLPPAPTAIPESESSAPAAGFPSPANPPFPVPAIRTVSPSDPIDTTRCPAPTSRSPALSTAKASGPLYTQHRLDCSRERVDTHDSTVPTFRHVDVAPRRQPQSRWDRGAPERTPVHRSPRSLRPLPRRLSRSLQSGRQSAGSDGSGCQRPAHSRRGPTPRPPAKRAGRPTPVRRPPNSRSRRCPPRPRTHPQKSTETPNHSERGSEVD